MWCARCGSSMVDGGTGGGGGGWEAVDDDWNCAECGAAQHPRAAECRSCGAPKPGGVEAAELLELQHREDEALRNLRSNQLASCPSLLCAARDAEFSDFSDGNDGSGEDGDGERTLTDEPEPADSSSDAGGDASGRPRVRMQWAEVLR